MGTRFNPIKTFKATLGIFSEDKGKVAKITDVADDNEISKHTFVRCFINGVETQKRIMAFENPGHVIATIEGCYAG